MILRKILPVSIVMLYIAIVWSLATNYVTMENGNSNPYESFEIYKESQEYFLFITLISYFFFLSDHIIIAPIMNSVAFVILYNYFVKIFRK